MNTSMGLLFSAFLLLGCAATTAQQVERHDVGIPTTQSSERHGGKNEEREATLVNLSLSGDGGKQIAALSVAVRVGGAASISVRDQQHPSTNWKGWTLECKVIEVRDRLFRITLNAAHHTGESEWQLRTDATVEEGIETEFATQGADASETRTLRVTIKRM